MLLWLTTISACTFAVPDKILNHRTSIDSESYHKNGALVCACFSTVRNCFFIYNCSYRCDCSQWWTIPNYMHVLWNGRSKCLPRLDPTTRQCLHHRRTKYNMSLLDTEHCAQVTRVGELVRKETAVHCPRVAHQRRDYCPNRVSGQQIHRLLVWAFAC